jgi:hypothetical protein
MDWSAQAPDFHADYAVTDSADETPTTKFIQIHGITSYFDHH